MPTNSVPLFRGTSDITIEDEVVTLMVDGVAICSQPLRAFRAGHERAIQRLAEYDARKAMVLHMPTRPKTGRRRPAR